MSLIQMTLSGGMFILFIVVVRALALHRLPKRAFLILWEMAALRLLLPFTIPLRLDMSAPAGRLAAVSEYLAAMGISIPGMPATGLPAAEPVPAEAASGTVLPLVRLAGTVLMAAYFAVAYVRARRRFCCSVPDDTPAVRRWLSGKTLRRPLEVRKSALVSSPLAYGVLRPVILLPENMGQGNENDLSYILAHEFIHIRRFDSMAKLAFAAVLCVHWFNPLIWAMYVLAGRDLELSCDECVINTLGGREKASYALALINMEETRSRCFSPCNHFSKLAIEERIEAIMKYKKASVLACLTSVALVIGATAVFAVSAQTDDMPCPDGHDAPPSAEKIETDIALISYVNSDDGKTCYSWDNGETFEPMTEEEFKQRFPQSNVEWWTYEEYAAWLENEKAELQAMLGEKGWTGGRGEFVWTQEVIDETIAMYENILQEIKEGALYSKFVDGDADCMLAIGGADSLTISTVE